MIQTHTAPLQAALAERILATRFADLPAEAVHWAKIGILDTVAVTIAGAVEPVTRIIGDSVGLGAGMGNGDGHCLIFGRDQRAPLLQAILINGTASHALDFDDVNRFVGGHPSVMVAPPAWALAEARGLSGQAVIAAYVAGFETACRMGRAVHPHHYDKGWHPTATVGIFGTVATAAHAMALDATQTGTALAIAASQASGLKANFGTMTKPFHVGHTLRNGVLAALLAENGLTASDHVFEDAQGYFQVFNGDGTYDADKALADWGAPWDIVATGPGLKQYPCCGSTHPGIDCLLDLRAKHRLGADNVIAIEMLTNPLRLPHTDNPEPRSGLEGKFSLHYVLARALVDGHVGLDHFDDAAVAEPDLRPIMGRITAGAHPEMGPESDNQFGAEVTVTMTDGSRHTARIDNRVCRGPADPMSDAELWTKFTDCVGRVLPTDRHRPLYDALMDLENAPDLSALDSLLTPPATASAAAE